MLTSAGEVSNAGREYYNTPLAHCRLHIPTGYRAGAATQFTFQWYQVSEATWAATGKCHLPHYSLPVYEGKDPSSLSRA